MSDIASIGSLIEKERERLWRHSPGLGLQSLWQQAAGADISANTRVQSLRNGIMVIACSSGGWTCELRLVSDGLMARLNAAGPPEKIRELKFIHQAQAGWKSRK